MYVKCLASDYGPLGKIKKLRNYPMNMRFESFFNTGSFPPPKQRDGHSGTCEGQILQVNSMRPSPNEFANTLYLASSALEACYISHKLGT